MRFGLPDKTQRTRPPERAGEVELLSNLPLKCMRDRLRHGHRVKLASICPSSTTYLLIRTALVLGDRCELESTKFQLFRRNKERKRGEFQEPEMQESYPNSIRKMDGIASSYFCSLEGGRGPVGQDRRIYIGRKILCKSLLASDSEGSQTRILNDQVIELLQ